MAKFKTLKQIVRDFKNKSEKSVVKMTLELQKELIKETPEDTGHAESNWLLSKGKPNLNVVGSKERVDKVSQNVGLLQIIGWKFIQGPLYITNNVDYIEMLNSGSSSQAPELFIEKTIKRVTDKYNKKVLS